MAGLLDFLDNEDSRMGMGLLMAASRRSDGAGIGQRLGEGMQYVQAQQDSDIKRKIQQAQVSNFQSEIDARKLATVKDQRQQAFMEQYYKGPNGGGGGGGASGMGGSGMPATSPGAYLPSSDGYGPTMPAPAQQQQPRGLADMTIDQVQELKDRGGIDHLAAWKIAKEGFERKPGSFYEGASGGREYIGDPTKGISFNNGVIGRMPGSSNIAAMAGETADATERIKALYKSLGDVTLRKNSNNTESPVTSFDENTTLQRYLGGGGGPTPQPMIGRMGNPLIDAYKQTESGFNPNVVSPKGARGDMQVMPGTETAPGFGVTPARDGSKAELSRVGVDYQAAMQDRYKDPALAAIAYNWGPGNADKWLKSGGDFNKLPPETQSYVAQVLTRNGVNSRNSQPAQAPAGPVQYGMTNDQVSANKAAEEKAVGTARADVVRDTGQQKESKLYGQLTVGLDRAISLLGQGPTASGAGALVDSTANFFGKSTKGADASSQLDTISGWLTSNVPRMEGPQSDKDVQNYRIMAGEVGDRTKPISQRIAAARELQGLQAKYAELNGGKANTGGATGDFGGNAAPKPAVQPYSDPLREQSYQLWKSRQGVK